MRADVADALLGALDRLERRVIRAAVANESRIDRFEGLGVVVLGVSGSNAVALLDAAMRAHEATRLSNERRRDDHLDASLLRRPPIGGAS